MPCKCVASNVKSEDLNIREIVSCKYCIDVRNLSKNSCKFCGETLTLESAEAITLLALESQEKIDKHTSTHAAAESLRAAQAAERRQFREAQKSERLKVEADAAQTQAENLRRKRQESQRSSPK